MEAIKVLIRVRPVFHNGNGSDNNTRTVVQISSDDKSISIDTHRQIQCKYNHIFGPKATQEEVYEHTKYCVDAALQGYNATIFAYGQTGSGKSHTMFGMDGGISANPGIVPRCIRDIFRGLNSVEGGSSVHVSFLQVYNEQVFDMFDKRMKPLMIHEKNGSIVVAKLMQYRVHNLEQCLALIDVGLKSRSIRETTMNHASSRSHSILQIVVEQSCIQESKKLCSKLNLVDLAGSERWGVCDMGDEQIEELTNINSR